MRNSQIENTIKVSDKSISKSNKILLSFFSFYLLLYILANTTIGGDIIKVIRCFRFIVYAVFAIDICYDFLFGKRKITLTVVFVVLCSFFIYLFSRHNAVLVLVLFLIELSKIPFSDLVKYSVITLFIGIAAVVASSLVGILENTVFNRGENVARYGLGFGWTTIGPFCFSFACLGWLYLRKTDISYYELIAITIIGITFFKFTDSRMAFLILLIIAGVGLFSKLLKNTNVKNIFDKAFIGKFLIGLPLMLVLLSLILVLYYKLQLPLADKINTLLSDRLRLSLRAFDEVGINFFGHAVEWRGWNQDTFFSENFDYFYVDNSYLRILFDYGIIGLLLVVVGYTFALRYSVKRKDYFLVFALLICCVDALISPNLLSFETNVFVFSLAPIMCGNIVAERKPILGNPEKVGAKSVVAVVVSFNRKVLLREALRALYKSNYKFLKVLIVDNASTDGTHAYIKDILDNYGDKFYYVNTGKNLGGAGGFNFGIKKALEMDADYIWLMDDDCIVNKTSLYELVKAAYDLNDDFGFLSSKVLWKDGTLSKMNIQRRNFCDKKFDCGKSGQKIRLASFVSLFLNRKAVETVGLPYKEFFIWGDDWEYTYRLSEKFGCYYVAESVVNHKSAVNVGVDISRESDDRLKRYFYYYRNEGYLYRKSGLFGCLYYLTKVAYHSVKIILSKCKSKKQRFGILLNGFFASWKFNPKTEYVFAKSSEIKVLEIFGEPISYGGQESLVKNLYENSDWEKVKFTFCTPFFCDNSGFIDATETRGDEIVADNKKFDSKLRKLSITSTALNIVGATKFDVVHVHAGSVFSLAVMARAAKRAGVKKVVVHAHSGGINKFSYRLMKKFSDKMLKKYADVFMCCSEIAAGWKFPKNIIDEKKYFFLKNGVQTEKFTFNALQRVEYRNKLLSEDMPIICQVARFTAEKNHCFTLQILKALKDKGFTFKALIIGDGPLKDDFVNGVVSFGLKDNVLFFEKRDDIPQILFASDVFILPSLYEGLPVSAVEAQAAGLYTLMSDTIATETKIIDAARFLSIDKEQDADIWADEIINRTELARETYAQKVRAAGFDIRDSAAYLETIYRGYN